MDILKSLEDFPSTSKPIAFTIGNFDGMHLGHQAVLKELKMALPQGQHVALSFKNHPSHILRPETAVEMLCSLPHRCKLFANAGVDTLILLEFTPELAQLPFDAFVDKVRLHCPFAVLILGHDATLGKARQGTKDAMQKLATHMDFKLDYVPPYTLEGTPVSSSLIRTAVRAGNLPQSEKLLGRPFSIYQTVQTGQGVGKRIGFPTLNIPVDGLCLPPLGVYAVQVRQADHTFKAVANLGIAPTVRLDQKPLLEVFLLDGEIQDPAPLEVLFHTYLRPEERFPSLEALKSQIALDVQRAHKILS